jgi:hypothetical protein
MEIWKDIKDFEGIYQVSNFGRVRRWRKKAKFWYLLKPLAHSGGYERLKLRNKGNDKDVYIHRLVAQSFLGINEEKVVNHIDGNRNNNRLDNLELVTQRENVSHGNKVKNLVGASYKKNRGKWASSIQLLGKSRFLGSFNCETAAHFAYLKALKENGITNKYA